MKPHRDIVTVYFVQDVKGDLFFTNEDTCFMGHQVGRTSPSLALAGHFDLDLC
jgi:hypothetical protein